MGDGEWGWGWGGVGWQHYRCMINRFNLASVKALSPRGIKYAQPQIRTASNTHSLKGRGDQWLISNHKGVLPPGRLIPPRGGCGKCLIHKFVLPMHVQSVKSIGWLLRPGKVRFADACPTNKNCLFFF